MMEAYTHLDMTSSDPIAGFQARMASAGIDRALAVETWKGDNYSSLRRLMAPPSLQFCVALCFRPDEQRPSLDILHKEVVVALRARTADLRRPGHLAEGAGLLYSLQSKFRSINEHITRHNRPVWRFHG
jgi:hypothetical protein